MKQREEEKNNSYIMKIWNFSQINYKKIIDLDENKTMKKKETEVIGNNLNQHIDILKKQMLEEAENLNFEKAATLRDEINKLQRKDLGIK